MSSIKWTTDQKKIIDTRNCNILVSAAAGSGKTAVLVERIYNRITDERNPVNVDQFLVVTFTNAAAAQMKDRLRSRIQKGLEEQPNNEHLQRQIGLLASAHISTIHSFCNFVIQNYFHRIGLDPSFRQGTQTEVDLIFSETVNEILEKEYEKCEDDFVELADMSSLNRKNGVIEEMLKSVYKYAIAEPFPLEFFSRMEQSLMAETEEEWEQLPLVQTMLAEAKQRVEKQRQEQEKIKQLCEEPDGPYYYKEAVLELGDICDFLLEAEGYHQWQKRISTLSFCSMRKKKDAMVREERQLEVKARMGTCKKMLKALAKELFSLEAGEHLQELKDMRGKILTVLRLTRQLHEDFVRQKRERNVVDFNDLEQLALAILLRWDQEKGEYVRTEAACELAEHFVEIMIDEYQDSNRVQDTLLRSVSREGLPGEKPNIFMVGDVKQSIYRFRGACPELFSEKLDTYSSEEDTLYRRIDLHQNFRSRAVVLEAANKVFEKAMHRDVGGVEYDERAALHVGKEFPECEENIARKADIIALSGPQNMEAEGIVIGQEIKQMVDEQNPLMICEDQKYRPAQYRDIVILVLAHAHGQEIYDALTESGIPTVMERKQGFFQAREISLMVSMLKVIDNPHQDVPLATVLLGPMFSFTEEELAAIRISHREMDLYDSLQSYEKADECYHKIQHFLTMLEGLRSKITYATVVDLVQDIYDATEIYESVLMMKDGLQRTANMDYLMEQARQFDGTTFHGLHQFVRYLEQIENSTEEMGEVNLSGEEENVVRIMTIHKSKGLEFPICFVAGMGKRLNQPQKGFLYIAPEIGIAAPTVDNIRRTKKENFYMNYIKRCNKIENVGECIRKLYVAMTRAEEKLVLVGCINKLDTRELDYEGRTKINTMFDMVLPSREAAVFDFQEIEQDQLLSVVKEEILQEEQDYELLYNFDTSVVYDKTMQGYLEWMDAREEAEEEPLPVKVSVSELKMDSMKEKDMEDFSVLGHDGEEEEEEMPIPSFMQTEEQISEAKMGAAYGTIWHQVMATIDFTKVISEAIIKDEITRLVESGRLREEERKVLNTKRLYCFFQSRLGQEMRQAAMDGKLHREQPFVMGRKACEIFEERKEEDTVLVQGIIDGYYETEDGIVLMDYKTDSLKEGQESRLLERYQTQMDLYRRALEEMTGKNVVRAVLYSFSLGKEIEC